MFRSSGGSLQNGKGSASAEMEAEAGAVRQSDAHVTKSGCNGHDIPRLDAMIAGSYGFLRRVVTACNRMNCGPALRMSPPNADLIRMLS